MAIKEADKLHKDGIKLFRRDKPDAAIEKFTEALEATEGDPRKSAEIYNDMGVAYRDLEDYPAAHNALDEAMSRFTELGDKKGQAQTLGNRGAVLQAQGELEKAVEVYKQSATMLEDVGENEMAMYVWQAVSKIRTKQGQYIAAIGAYEEGIDNMPQSSFKRKILKNILKTPSTLLGGPSLPDSDEDEDDDE